MLNYFTFHEKDRENHGHYVLIIGSRNDALKFMHDKYGERGFLRHYEGRKDLADLECPHGQLYRVDLSDPDKPAIIQEPQEVKESETNGTQTTDTRTAGDREDNNTTESGSGVFEAGASA